MQDNYKKPNTAKKELHPLGYDPDAPLPMMLTDDDLYEPVKIRQDVSKTHPELVELTELLANFVNSSRSVGLDGVPIYMDEREFVTVWLPAFYNEKTSSGVSVDDSWERYIAGFDKGNNTNGRNLVVNIVRDGRVIYRVPPLQGRTNIISTNDRKKSITLMSKDVQDMTERLPSSYRVQVDNMVESIDNDKRVSNTDVNIKYLIVLDEIFTYYGYNSILTPEIMKYKQYLLNKLKLMEGGNNGTGTFGGISTSTDAEYVDDGSDLFD